MFKKILIALDGSVHAAKALDLASDLAAKYGAEMLLLHVADRSVTPSRVEQFAAEQQLKGQPQMIYKWGMSEKILREGKERAAQRGVRAVRIASKEGDPAEVIVAFAAAEAVDAVVMGTRGLGTFGGLFLGSVARKVGHGAGCSVVTVK